MVTVHHLDTNNISAGACAGIYNRSWPTTAKPSFTDEQIAHRIATRPLRFWVDMLDRSTAAGFATHNNTSGFVLVTPETDGLELSYLFVEPEAFNTGLAASLHQYAIDHTETLMHCWILEHNMRSRNFFTRHGWQHSADLEAMHNLRPPWSDGATYIRLNQPDPR